MPDYRGIPFNGGLDGPTGTGAQNIVLALKAIIDFLQGCVAAGVLADVGGIGSVEWTDRFLVAATGNASLNWDAGLLINPTDTTDALDWPNRHLLDAAGNPAVDWNIRLISDASNVPCFDGVNRLLIDSGGSAPSINWNTRTALDNSEVLSIDWNDRLLSDSSGISSVNWVSRILSDQSGTVRLIYNSDGLAAPGLPTSDPGSPGVLYQIAGQVMVSL